jgi:hypothetical protein
MKLMFKMTHIQKRQLKIVRNRMFVLSMIVCGVLSFRCSKNGSSIYTIHTYNTKQYAINTNHFDVYPVARAAIPDGWKPDNSLDLDSALPFPWPDKYIEIFKQPFAPWAFFKNAAILNAYYIETGDERALVLMKALVDRFLQYTVKQDDKRFVLYDFPKPYRKIDVEVPWTSAYASGAALIGLALMNESLELHEINHLMYEIVNGLGNPINPMHVRPRYWVSFVDEKGYLWFEEMPLDREEQPRILNGHIRAITGLYIYYVYTGDQTALELLRGGIYTVEKYAMSYRREGKVNAYDLMEPYIADYGPARTINQQHVLYKMTGESLFLENANIFQADIDAFERAKAEEL